MLNKIFSQDGFFSRKINFTMYHARVSDQFLTDHV